MMNLSEFLENWNSDTQIFVATSTEKIFCGKVSDMSEDVACKYWIPKTGVKYDKEIMYITVEHENEVNRKLEERNSISFSAVWENIKKDAKLNEETKKQFDSMIKAANHYTYYRKNWNRFLNGNLEKLNEERSLNRDIFISELDNLADLVEKIIGKKVIWRVALGDNQHQLGEFAKYMIDRIENVHKRISILEAIKWAQEHQNQIYHLFDETIDEKDATLQLMMKYNFSEEQAIAIRDMRIRTFCDKEKKAIKKELIDLLKMEEL